MPGNVIPSADRALWVAQVVDELAPAGGIEEALATLVAALETRHCRSVVLSFQPPATENPYARRWRAAGLQVHVPPRRLARARLNLASVTRWAAVSVMLVAWPLSLLAAAALVVGRGHSPRRAWQSRFGRVQRGLPVERRLGQAWQGYLYNGLRRQGVDFVHVHGYGCGAVPSWGQTAAVASGVPVVYTEHGIPWPELEQRGHL